VTLAVALHDSGAPPVLRTVNCVCAATQVERVMVVGWTLRVAGTGVAVGAVVAVGVAVERRTVAVGALPCAVAVADAPEKDCDDELEFADESLLEKGASVMLKLRWRNTKRSAATSRAARTAPAPSPSARRNPPEDARGVCGTCDVGQMASRA
jgi:hypothetical protein